MICSSSSFGTNAVHRMPITANDALQRPGQQRAHTEPRWLGQVHWHQQLIQLCLGALRTGFPSLPTMPFSGLVNNGPPPANGGAQGETAAANGGDEGLLRDMLSPVPSLLRGGEPSGRCARTASVFTFFTHFYSYIMSCQANCLCQLRSYAAH